MVGVVNAWVDSSVRFKVIIFVLNNVEDFFVTIIADVIGVCVGECGIVGRVKMLIVVVKTLAVPAKGSSLLLTTFINCMIFLTRHS